MCAAATQPAAPAQSFSMSSLCDACKSIFDGSTLKNENGEVEHHGLETLASRAAQGCSLCLTVYMSIDPDVYRRYKSHSPNSSTNGHVNGSGSGNGEKRHVSETLGFACVSPIARDQARLKFRYVKVSGSSTNGHINGSPQHDEKGKGRVYSATPTPSMSSSKLSLPLSTSSDKEGDGVPAIVELILMNPKCK
jgi:hypothetical protein